MLIKSKMFVIYITKIFSLCSKVIYPDMEIPKIICLNFEDYLTSEEIILCVTNFAFFLLILLYASIMLFKYFLYLVYPIEEEVDQKAVSNTRILETVASQIVFLVVFFELHLKASTILIKTLQKLTFYSLSVDFVINFIILFGHPRFLLSIFWLLFEIHLFLLKICIWNLYTFNTYEVAVLIEIPILFYCCYDLFWKKENPNFPVLE